MKISCKMCGANLKYIPSMQKVSCEHCGSAFMPEEIIYANDGFDELNECVCSSCGATLVANGKTGIIKCIYCGGKEFVNGKVNKEYILDGIIPFEIDREEFVKDCKKHLKELRNVERGFIEKIDEATITGFYLPYSFANSFYRKQYRKEFNELLEKILPYNFKDLRKMNPVYLDDFVTEIVKTKREENDIKTNDPSFFWVPIWTANIEYMGKEYYIVMNGQNGKMAGTCKYRKEEDKRELERKRLRKIGRIVLCMIGIYGIFQSATKYNLILLNFFSLLTLSLLMFGPFYESFSGSNISVIEKELMEKGTFTTNKYYRKQK